MSRPLVIMRAPVGYGKTAAVQELMTLFNNQNLYWSDSNSETLESGESKKTKKRSLYYMSLNPGECSPEYLLDIHQFFLSSSDSPLGQIAKQYPSLTNLDDRNRIISKVKEITFINPLLLVIDDYHYVTDMRLHSFFERVIKARIKGLTFLILSRTIPDLPLVEFSVKGWCQTFGVEELAFDEAEARSFFHLNGLNDENFIQQAWASSEGWPSALRLHAEEGLRSGRPVPKSTFYGLFDSAFLATCSAEEKLLLKKLSIFDDFSPKTAVEVGGLSHAVPSLRTLIDRGAFINFNHETKKFKYHNLFRAFCNAEFQLLEPQTLDKRALYRLAADWLLVNNQAVEALDFLIQAGRDNDLEYVLRLFEEPLFQRAVFDSRRDLGPLITTLPPPVRIIRPLGYLALIHCHGLSVGPKAASSLIDEAITDLKQAPSLEPQSLSQLCIQAEYCRAFMTFQDFQETIELLARVKTALDHQTVQLDPGPSWTFGCPQASFLHLNQPGQYQSLVETMQRSWPEFMGLTDCWGLGGSKIIASERALESGRFEEAELLAELAVTEAQCRNGRDVLLAAALVRLRAALARKKTDRALELLKDLPGEELGPDSNLDDHTGNLIRAYVNSTLGLIERLPAWVKDGQIAPDAPWAWWGLSPLSQVVQARNLMWRLEHTKLLGLTQYLKHLYLGPPAMLIGRLHVTVLEAIALWNHSGPKSSTIALQHALELAAPDHLILILSEYGKHITPLLKHFLTENPKTELAALADEAYQLALNYESLATAHVPEKIRIKKLTQRELRFLDQVILGRSNQQIAELYNIQRITVTKALSNAYRKLGVKNRSQAIHQMLSTD
ncbi:MAG: LuxR C-terminal-related transcriptional regulator [Deltaproteobacteria bacterium]|nr:LuxR C-terminal-related transcriptional regulator [Deltaproteobacteria bacterium]